VHNLRSYFTFIAVRYTADNITIGKGGRGPAADSEEGKFWRRFFQSRATRVVGVVVLGMVVVAVVFVLLNWYVAPTKTSERGTSFNPLSSSWPGGLGCSSAPVWSGFSAYHAYAGAYGSCENSKSGAPKRMRCRRTWIRWFDC
jgi:hypothetical protein